MERPDLLAEWQGFGVGFGAASLRFVPKVSDAHKARVRDGLIEAAARVMARSGATGTTTRAVIEEAGVSAGTLYNYFPSKADLLVTVGQHLLAADWQELVGILDPEQPEGGLRNLLDATVFSPDQAPERAAGAQLRSRPPSDEAERAALARFNAFAVNTVVPVVLEGQSAGHVAADIDAAALVEMLEALGGALITREAQGSWATSHQRVTDVVRVLLDAAVLSPEHGPST